MLLSIHKLCQTLPSIMGGKCHLVSLIQTTIKEMVANLSKEQNVNSKLFYF